MRGSRGPRASDGTIRQIEPKSPGHLIQLGVLGNTKALTPKGCPSVMHGHPNAQPRAASSRESRNCVPDVSAEEINFIKSIPQIRPSGRFEIYKVAPNIVLTQHEKKKEAILCL